MYYLESFEKSDQLIKAINDHIKFYTESRVQRKLKSNTPLEYFLLDIVF